VAFPQHVEECTLAVRPILKWEIVRGVSVKWSHRIKRQRVHVVYLCAILLFLADVAKACTRFAPPTNFRIAGIGNFTTA